MAVDNIGKLRKGSLTVEAAGLMGVVLLVIFAVLFAEFYVLDRDWLTISAYEAAITGGIEERLKEGNGKTAARERGEYLGSLGFFGLQDLNLGVTGGKTLQVTYTGKVSSVNGGHQAGLSCVGKYKVIKPVSELRRIRELKKIGDLFLDGG